MDEMRKFKQLAPKAEKAQIEKNEVKLPKRCKECLQSELCDYEICLNWWH